jgi:hypothetical protein
MYFTTQSGATPVWSASTVASPCAQVVDHRDFVIVLEKSVHDVAPNEAGSTGDEYLHDMSLLSSHRKQVVNAVLKCGLERVALR